jgi:serine/threonine-protein kinase
MGTPEYMSPEQLRGEEVGFRSDLYSFGIVVYELFTGTLPFRGDTPVATIVRQLQERPFLDLPTLPVPLRKVLARALAKDPAERYATAEEMHAALEAACQVSAPSATARHAEEHGSDETRPIAGLPRLWTAPLVRIAVAQAALAALAVHLLAAGGVRLPPSALPPAVAVRAPLAALPPAPTPTPATEAEPPSPFVRVEPRLPIRRPIAVRATPVPTPLPIGTVALPDVEAPAAPLPTARPVDPSRVYEENEVDVRPRRLAGVTASYPEWGPKLPKGRSVSITASYVVTEEGLVTDIRVERGGGVLEAVLLEISRWRFEPATVGGVPVKVRLQWKHTFIGG